MILNFKTDKIMSIIAMMDVDNRFEFVLTGSKFFDSNSNSSGWDFFCKNSSKVEEFLKFLGFELNEDNYSDNYSLHGIAKVYRFTDESQNIDVQLVDNFAIKSKAQRLIYDLHQLLNFNSRDKETRRIIWKTVVQYLS
jgi:hypothetical protein